VTAALLYTHTGRSTSSHVGIWLVVSVVRDRRHGQADAAPRAALFAVAVGVLLFVPWVPTFIYQAKHTEPVGGTANFSAVINASRASRTTRARRCRPGRTGPPPRRHLLRHAGARRLRHRPVRRIIELDLHTRPRSRSLGFVVLGTLFAAIAAASSRQRVLVALRRRRFSALPPPRGTGDGDAAQPEGPVIIVGLASWPAWCPPPERHHAADPGEQCAAAINADAKPGTSSPSARTSWVLRLPRIHDPSQYDMLTFPAARGPPSSTGSTTPTPCTGRPQLLPDDLVQRADEPPRLVGLGADVQTYGIKCETIATDLLTRHQERWGGRNLVTITPPCTTSR